MAWPAHVRRHRRTSITEADWNEEDRGHETLCWIWNKALSSTGYANVKMNQKQLKAHRWMYEHHIGPIPSGLHLDHLCRQPACVRPDHLEPVTVGENLRRGANARLTHDDVLSLRGMADSKPVSELASIFGITEGHVYAIIARRAWKED